ncbi:hypothetical protein [Neobacillus cucumis]|nr:hypothetical protein [Neobacillus cucumis]MBM7650908.1 hypothetical protein [Neobacillus cucumis]MED4228511.1 hypothetical protein [Neobacillus cucumis]
MWIRLIPIVLFSVTALSLLTYQSFEIVHAFFDFFSNDSNNLDA